MMWWRAIHITWIKYKEQWKKEYPGQPSAMDIRGPLHPIRTLWALTNNHSYSQKYCSRSHLGIVHLGQSQTTRWDKSTICSLDILPFNRLISRSYGGVRTERSSPGIKVHLTHPPQTRLFRIPSGCSSGLARPRPIQMGRKMRESFIFRSDGGSRIDIRKVAKLDISQVIGKK